ncbi:MAG: flagellar M-ring protein FliF [Sphingomonadales bacterium]|nr:flagellar M-ring protein FliF [Sphingomonadales bacterium]
MEGLIRFINALGAGRVITMFAVTAAIVGGLMFMTMRVSQPQMRMLYGDLEAADASSIIQRLEGMNVPYKLQNDGRSIFVPEDKVSTLRVSMAGEGLGGSIVGYEIFDRGDTLGTTSFVQNINRVRAIEGELARTIRELSAVSTARVHIVMPERQLFSQEGRKPSASIVIRAGAGGMGAGQVRAIQYLVASAVPGLEAGRVSIVDQRGTLLARATDSEDEASMAASLDEKRQNYENRLRNQIENLLENTVGFGRVRAQVSVQMDLNRVTTNSETYDPDSQVVRSSSTITDTAENSEGEAQPVTVGANIPNPNASAAGEETSSSSTERTEETVNFEISRTITTQIKEMGQVQRVSVGVLVDGRYTADEEGNRAYTARPQAEIDQLSSLVRSAIGFDQDRGDTVSVVNLQFSDFTQGLDAPQAFNFMGLTKDDLSELLEVLVYGVVMILVLLTVIRPLVTRIAAAIPDASSLAPPEEQMTVTGPDGTPQLAAPGQPVAMQPRTGPDGVPIEQMIDVAQVEGKVQDSAMKKVGDIVTRHPEEAAAIVRQWMYSD